MTIVYTCGKHHSCSDCLRKVPVCPSLTNDYDEHTALFEVLDVPTNSEKQREDAELRPLHDFLQGRIHIMPKTFARRLSSFCLCSPVLY